MNTEEKVRETLESGLEPIELTYRTVYNCSMQDPIAYRTKLVINSVTLGTLGPESYSITAEQSGRAARIAAKAFDLILRKINEFTAKGTMFEWISYECPVTLLMNGDLAESINTAYGGDKKKLSKLCVEFPSSILYSDPADIKNKLLDLQALSDPAYKQ